LSPYGSDEDVTTLLDEILPFCCYKENGMNAQAATKDIHEVSASVDDGCIELSDTELRALIDTQARESLHLSGEEFLRRYRERKPIVNDLGQPVPSWGPLSNLAWLLDE
jgi:hypothetical protein